MTDTTAVYMRVSTRDQDVASQRRQIDQWLATQIRDATAKASKMPNHRQAATPARGVIAAVLAPLMTVL